MKAKLIKGKLVKQTKYSAGYDMYAQDDVLVEARSCAIIPTGVFIEIQEGYEGQVRTRSGLNFNHSLVVPIGTIDADYRGEVKVKIYNHSDRDYMIEEGTRVAQLVISKCYDIDGAEIKDQDRNGGFGSTGK